MEWYVEQLKIKNIPLEPLEDYVSTHTPILHKCLICRTTRFASPHNCLAGKLCPTCHNSKGENKIRDFLLLNNIVFEQQYKFDGCKNVRNLKFDFYLPKCNTAIEYDGELHYMSVEHFGGNESLEYRKELDEIKTNYCNNNGVNLIRIPYWDYDNIEKILSKALELDSLSA